MRPVLPVRRGVGPGSRAARGLLASLLCAHATHRTRDTAHVTAACGPAAGRSFSTALLVLVLVLARARRRGPVHMQQPALVLQVPAALFAAAGVPRKPPRLHDPPRGSAWSVLLLHKLASLALSFYPLSIEVRLTDARVTKRDTDSNKAVQNWKTK